MIYQLFHTIFYRTRLLLSLSWRLLIIINPLLHSILHILKLYHESMYHHSWTVHHHQHKSIRYINTNTTTEAYTCCSIWSLGLSTTQGFPAYGLELADILLKLEGEWGLKYIKKIKILGILICVCIQFKKNPHRGGILTCTHMPPSSPKKILLKGGFHKRWDKRLTQKILHSGRIMARILHIEGYLHTFTFYSAHSAEALDKVILSIPNPQSRQLTISPKVISAQIPDPHSRLYQLVTSQMIHHCSPNRCLNQYIWEVQEEFSKGIL